MNNHQYLNFIAERISTLKEQNLFRKLTVAEEVTEKYIIKNKKRLLNLSSNNYLGIARHPAILKKMEEGLTKGASYSSARLVIGQTKEIQELEEKIAWHTEKEQALLFSCGYMMNIGVLSSIAAISDVIFSDQLNHASIIDGIILSRKKNFRYRHNNMNHLEMLLKKTQNYKKKVIVTDTVFSMDGDIANLKDLVFLKEKYGALLIIDDAHGGGVFSDKGQGYAHSISLQNHIDLTLGTFSKAYGVYGAYVSGNKKFITYILNTARSFIYTTALPPTLIYGIDKAISVVREAQNLRNHLYNISQKFRKELQNMGFNTLNSSTQIIPLVIENEIKALEFSKKLEENNILAVAIRKPTVKTSRIRFSLNANLTLEDCQKTLKACQKIGKELNLI